MFLDYDRLPGIVPNLTVTNTGLFCKNGFPIEGFLTLQIPRRSESLLLYYNIPQNTSDSSCLIISKTKKGGSYAFIKMKAEEPSCLFYIHND